MQAYTGTSGFSYKEWKGVFYPQELPHGKMLSYYAEHLSAVEINNTFYRLPKPDVLASWIEDVPASFRFVLKASRRITHFKRLKDATDVTEYMLSTAARLGRRLGAVLFQMPPNFARDLDRLRSFLPLIGDDVRAAFEFRHDSWRHPDVFAALQEHNAAWCVADAEKEPEEIVTTADWGYLRLRRPEYSADQLARWAAAISGQPWNDVFVFFKHEDAGAGPKMASEFLKLLDPTER